MRIFFGIELDGNIKDACQLLINELSYKSERDIKWVKKGNLHLTLQFIGDTSEPNIEKLKNLASNIDFSPFQIKPVKLGAFPYLGKPRVIWVGVKEDSNRLMKLQKDVQDISLTIGAKQDDKPYHPHITLARVKGRLSSDYLDSLKKHKDIEFEEQTVKDFSLFSSQLTRKGPIYTVISRFEAK